MCCLAIGGVGGSGTRLLAELLSDCGFFIGGSLNPASDNLWFTFFLRRPDWASKFPSDAEIVQALQVYFRCMQRTTGMSSTHDDDDYINSVLDKWRQHSSFDSRWEPVGRALLSASKMRTEGQRWAWKEPNTHVFLPWLNQFSPDLKYLHVVRNGFDMAFSQNQNQLNAWGPYFGVSNVPASPIESRSLDFWIAANKRAIEFGETMGERFKLLRYEDLVNEPSRIVPEIMAFAGITIDPSIVNKTVKSIAPSSVGRHRSRHSAIFTEDQIQRVTNLGYQARFSDMDF